MSLISLDIIYHFKAKAMKKAVIVLVGIALTCSCSHKVVYSDKPEPDVKRKRAVIVVYPKRPFLYNGMKRSEFRTKIDSAFIYQQMQIDSLKAVINQIQ